MRVVRLPAALAAVVVPGLAIVVPGLVAAAAVLVPTNASAQIPEFGLGAHAGSAGLGVDVTLTFNPWLTLRGTWQRYDRSHSLSEAGIDYDGRLKLDSQGVLADIHPGGGAFRVTAGLLRNRNRVPVTATATGGTITVNGVPYPAADVGTLTGELTSSSSTAVYAGIGAGNARGGGVHPRFDLGVMYQGAPRARLDVTGSRLATDDPAAYAQLLAGLREQERRTEDDVRRYRWWPVVQVGLVVVF
jgi:hypothetical protein